MLTDFKCIVNRKKSVTEGLVESLKSLEEELKSLEEKLIRQLRLREKVMLERSQKNHQLNNNDERNFPSNNVYPQHVRSSEDIHEDIPLIFLNRQQLAERWNCSVRTIDNLRNGGGLPWLNLSGRFGTYSNSKVRFRYEDVIEYENINTVGSIIREVSR